METHLKVSSPKLMAFILMAGAFIGLFSETALNMALTNIMEEFSVSTATAQWLTTGYLLVLAIFVPISAILVRWFTTKQLVVTGLLFSILGALLAALAINFPMLLMGRLVQAMGTGIIIPVMNIVVLMIFPINRRGVVMGLMGLVITTAPALGPTLAGFIVTAWNWTYIFWIVIVLYVLLFLGINKIDNASMITKPKVDILSIVLSTLGFGGIIYALSMLAENSLTALIVWLPGVIGIVALILFSKRQLSMEQPMVNIRVFKNPMFTLGTLTMFLGILIILSTSILLPIYLKGVLLVSAAVAGLILLPGNLINVILAPVVGTLFDRFGGRAKGFVILGSIFLSIGSIMFAFILSDTTPIWQIIVAFILVFIGVSLVMMPSQTNAMNQLPRESYADGAAAMNTLNQVAGAAGTAIAITLFTTGQQTFMLNNPTGTAQQMLASGTQTAFIFISIVALLIFIAALAIKQPKK